MRVHLWAAILSATLAPMPVLSLTLQDAILYVLQTNPEITAAEANKQAIEFELDQARSFWAPRVALEAFSGATLNEGTRDSDRNASEDALSGYEVSARVTQRIFDGFGIRSEVERQAYRIDGAALRVLERSEFLGLEATRLYAEVLRLRRIRAFAEENLAYHREVLGRVRRGVDSGVLTLSDLQQAEERTFVAEEEIVLIDLERAEQEALFLEVVGVAARDLGAVPSLAGAIPATLDSALSAARRNNPSVRFLQADVGAADALVRAAGSDLYPSLDIEAERRYGEDLDGFEGIRNETRLGLVLRYEFQGGQTSALRQEQVRRAAEARADLLTQTRLVEREMRQTWAGRAAVRRQIDLLAGQAATALDLRESYEQEFELGQRSLLDVLNTQGALFQAQVNLVNARSLATFVDYRLLAAAGLLLRTLDVAPPPDAVAYAAQAVGAPPASTVDVNTRFDPGVFRDWRRGLASD